MWTDIKNILRRLFQTQFGLDGDNLNVNDTATHTGLWSSVYFMTDTVISAITIDGSADAVIPAVGTWDAHSIIYGRITSITLTSGYVRLYGGNTAGLI